MSIEAIIREKLTKAFAPTRLDVINEFASACRTSRLARNR